MREVNFFKKNYDKAIRRFFGGVFLLLVVLVLLMFNGLSDNIWGLLSLMLYAPGLYLLVWSFIKIPSMRRANSILKIKFPQEFNRVDLENHSELSLSIIGTYIYGDYLFVLNKSWYYSICLSDVVWLFVIVMNSSISSEDVLVVNTINKKRFYFSLPELNGSGKYKWVSTSENIKYIDYLFEYISINYPNIDLGYSWKKDIVFLKDKSFMRKIHEKFIGHGKHKKWVDLNRKYVSKLI